VGDWVESTNVNSVRISSWASLTPPNISIEESIDGVTALAPGGFAMHSGDTLNVSARYFRLNVTGGAAGGVFRASVRSLA
jgi:hypothetical protein